MVRLYLFAEGETEENFANKLLMPHLASQGVYLAAVMVSRGGEADPSGRCPELRAD